MIIIVITLLKQNRYRSIVFWCSRRFLLRPVIVLDRANVHLGARSCNCVFFICCVLLMIFVGSDISDTERRRRRERLKERGRIEELWRRYARSERPGGKGGERTVGKKERWGASEKVEKDNRWPSGPFKVPRRQQRASNELIKLSNSFGLASERANKCSPLPRGPLQRSRAPSAELWAKFMHVPRLRSTSSSADGAFPDVRVRWREKLVLNN